MNRALLDTRLVRGATCPVLGQWVRALGPVPLALGTLAVLIVPLLGPQCVAVRMQREDGRAGGLSPHGICLGLRSGMCLWSRRGRLQGESPHSPSQPL